MAVKKSTGQKKTKGKTKEKPTTVAESLDVAPSGGRQRAPSELAVHDIEEPREKDAEKQIEWIFRCLGLGDERDDVAKEVFKELVVHTKRGVRSVEISGKCHVSQGAVVYHLNTMMRSGMVIKQGRYYYLRRATLDRTIDDMEAEMIRRFERMKHIARMIEEGRE